jgi:hypothetical protein
MKNDSDQTERITKIITLSDDKIEKKTKKETKEGKNGKSKSREGKLTNFYFLEQASNSIGEISEPSGNISSEGFHSSAEHSPEIHHSAAHFTDSSA